MAKEEFVGYDVALALKERGFNGETFTYFHIHDRKDFEQMSNAEFNSMCESDWEQVWDGYSFHNKDNKYRAARCSQQVAMRWLREEYNIAIRPTPYITEDNEFLWAYEVLGMEKGKGVYTYAKGAAFKSYESACETAIKEGIKFTYGKD